MYSRSYPCRNSSYVQFDWPFTLTKLTLHLLIKLMAPGIQVTNTVPQSSYAYNLCSKLVTVDISPTIAESIRRVHNGESISFLFADSL